MDINTYIFSRYAAAKKVEAVKALTKNELFSVTPATIRKMIMEVGKNRYKSRDRDLCIPSNLQEGNDWNSHLTWVGISKGKLFVGFYVQFANTDTDTVDYLETFLRRGDYRDSLTRNDRYGNPQTYYFNYDEDDKAKCIRSILLAYLYIKYADKLKDA